jgi:hypothetical protein
MRSPHRAIPLFVAALLLAAVLLVGDALAAPAHAVSRRAVVPSAISRRPHTMYVRRTVRRPVRRTSRRRIAIRSAAPAPVPVAGDVWARLRQCESGGRYDISTGNGYFGAYQFKLSTWRGLGYPGYPHQAPPQVQDEAAQKLQARSGWGQWPACSRRIGVR